MVDNQTDCSSKYQLVVRENLQFEIRYNNMEWGYNQMCLGQTNKCGGIISFYWTLPALQRVIAVLSLVSNL